MFHTNIKFEDLLNSVKKVRGICNPNMGFTVQLMNWYDRLYSEFNAISLNPRVFLISSLSAEQPTWIVAKFIIDPNLFKKEGNCFDSRGV